MHWRYQDAHCQATPTPSTYHVEAERNNLNVRMHSRRMTRLTNAFSTKMENHAHAMALHFLYYNFVRIHKTLKVTPAMAAGVTDRLLGSCGYGRCVRSLGSKDKPDGRNDGIVAKESAVTNEAGLHTPDIEEDKSPPQPAPPLPQTRKFDMRSFLEHTKLYLGILGSVVALFSASLGIFPFLDEIQPTVIQTEKKPSSVDFTVTTGHWKIDGLCI